VYRVSGVGEDRRTPYNADTSRGTERDAERHTVAEAAAASKRRETRSSKWKEQRND